MPAALSASSAVTALLLAAMALRPSPALVGIAEVLRKVCMCPWPCVHAHHMCIRCLHGACEQGCIGLGLP